MMPVCLQQRDWPYHQTRPVLGRFKSEASVELRCLSAGRPATCSAQLVPCVVVEVHLEVGGAASPRRT